MYCAKNDCLFQGETKDFKPHGEGTVLWAQLGCSYEGTFEDGSFKKGVLKMHGDATKEVALNGKWDSIQDPT